MLQDQERAYFMMQFDDGAAMRDAVDADAADEVEDESLALARRLQEEEEREYRNRFLAMAGIDPNAEDDSEAAEGLDTDAMTYEELIELGEHVGKVTCGLTDAQIESLPKMKAGDASVNDPRCAVCCMEFEVNEDVCSLPRCKHAFHGECVEPWLRENKTCPMCKQEVFDEEEKK